MVDHLLLLLLGQLWELIDILPCVRASWNADWECEDELGNDLVPEKVFLDQNQFFKRLVFLYAVECQVQLQVLEHEESR